MYQSVLELVNQRIRDIGRGEENDLRHASCACFGSGCICSGGM